MAISVLLVAHPLASADGWAAVLDTTAGITVVGRAGTGEDARRLTEELRPRVVVVDQALSDGKGSAVAEALRDERPELATVLMGRAHDEALIVAAVDAGCAGYVPMCDVERKLADVVRAAACGDVTFPAWALTNRIPRRRDPEETVRKLTPREYAVLDLLVAGRSPSQIAEILGVAPSTVRGHVRRVRTKLHATTTTEAIRTAMRYGVFR